MTQRERYDHLKAERRCTCCGVQDERTLSGRVRCNPCMDYVKKRRLQQEGALIRAGVCVKCHGPVEPERIGMRMCAGCARAHSEYMVRIQHQRIASGICTRCGKPMEPERVGMHLCTACSTKKYEKVMA